MVIGIILNFHRGTFRHQISYVIVSRHAAVSQHMLCNILTNFLCIMHLNILYLKDQHPAEIKPGVQKDAERSRDESRPGQEEKEEEEEEDDDEDEEEEEEEDCSVSVEAELACMEEKWREQCTINENLKLLLANEEKQFKVCKHIHRRTHMIQVPLIPLGRPSHRYTHIHLHKMSAHTSVQTRLNFIGLIFRSGSLKYHISVSRVCECNGSHKGQSWPSGKEVLKDCSCLSI